MGNLKTANKVFAGSTPAKKVYKGSTLVWQDEVTPPTLYSPPTTCWFSFNDGVDGAACTASDTGGVTLDFVSAGSVTYSTSGAKNGGMGVRTTGSNGGYIQWNRTANTKHALAKWIKFETTPTADARIFDIRNTSSAGTVGGIVYTTGNRFCIMQGSGVISTGQSPVATPNSWYWVTQTWDCTTKISRFLVFDSNGNLWHDSGPVSMTTTYADATTVRFGRPVAWSATTSWDDPQWEPGSITPIWPWYGPFEKPSAANTGYDPDLIDGTLSTTQWLSTAGQILQNKIVNARVVIQADNVTLRNCYIRGSSTDEWLVEFRNNGGLIENCQLDPVNPTAKVYNAIRGHGFTARRNNISRVCDAFSIYDPVLANPANVIIEFNYVHDLYFGPDPGQSDGNTHNDGIQIHSNGGVMARFNCFEMFPVASPAPTHPGATSCLIVTNGVSGTPDQPDIFYTDNWLTGHVGAMVNLAASTTPTTAHVERNIIDDTHPLYTPSYDILAVTSATLTVPGLPASTGQDVNNGNIQLSTNGPVTVTRVAP